MLRGKSDASSDQARPLIKPVRTPTATAVWGTFEPADSGSLYSGTLLKKKTRRKNT